MIIAIDGPAGSGKSTIAKLLADKLNYQYIDTGAMYRVITLLMLENKYSEINLADNTELLDENVDIELAARILPIAAIRLDGKKVFSGKRDLSVEIRSPLIGSNVAHVAAMPIVREFLVEEQRKLGAYKDCVMDGRDIGTVVFPNAQLKVFLTASAEIRAKRRLKDFAGHGMDMEIETLIADIKARDKKDMERAVSPLRKADDAIELISDNMTVDEVLAEIAGYQRSKLIPKS